MGLYRRKDNGKEAPTWWMSFVVDGRQHRRSIETGDKDSASEIFDEIKRQIKMGTWYDIDESKTRTFDDMMEEYFSMIDDKPSTIERKEDAFVHLIITFMLQCHANPHAPLAQ